jgi:hypothetical protein
VTVAPSPTFRFVSGFAGRRGVPEVNDRDETIAWRRRFLFRRRSLGHSVNDQAAQSLGSSECSSKILCIVWGRGSPMTSTRAAAPQPHLHTAHPLVIMHQWYHARHEPAGRNDAVTQQRSTRRPRNGATAGSAPRTTSPCVGSREGSRGGLKRDSKLLRDWPMPPGPMARRCTAAVMTMRR